MTPKAEPSAARTGRPRNLDPQHELELLLDATLTVLRRNDYADVTIASILEEAGLGTRSFYRHFQSKDELLLTLFRRDAEVAATRLRTRIRAAPTPDKALEAWIDEILSFKFHRRKAERVAVLGSASARRAEGYEAELVHAGQLLAAPLIEVLEDGKQDGSFSTCKPQTDAEMISSIVFNFAGVSGASRRVPAAAATRDIFEFCLRALGTKAPLRSS